MLLNFLIPAWMTTLLTPSEFGCFGDCKANRAIGKGGAATQEVEPAWFSFESQTFRVHLVFFVVFELDRELGVSSRSLAFVFENPATRGVAGSSRWTMICCDSSSQSVQNEWSLLYSSYFLELQVHGLLRFVNTISAKWMIIASIIIPN